MVRTDLYGTLISCLKQLLDLKNIYSNENVNNKYKGVDDVMFDGIRIRIEKNNYNKGALNFQIFNPENGEYDEVNAFSDENQLLKFTSETREITEYADDFIRILLLTYKRMGGIELEFYGSLSDYNVLIDALNKQTTDNRYVINPHCDMDPQTLCECLNNYINELNAEIFSEKTENQIQDIQKISGYYLIKIRSINHSNSAQELLKQSDDVVNDIEILVSKLKSISEYIETIKSGYWESLSNHTKEINDVENSYETIFWDTAADLRDDTERKICIELNKVTEYLTNEYVDKEKLSGTALQQYTSQIAYNAFTSIAEALSSCILEYLKKIYAESAIKIQNINSELLGCKANELKYTCSFDRETIKAYLFDELGFIKTRYDNGEIKIFRNQRKYGVREVVVKKEPITFSIDTKAYIEYYFSYYNLSNRISVITKGFLRNEAKAFVTMVIDSNEKTTDYVEKDIKSCISNCEEQIELVNLLLRKAKNTKYKINSQVKSAKVGVNLK